MAGAVKTQFKSAFTNQTLERNFRSANPKRAKIDASGQYWNGTSYENRQITVEFPFGPSDMQFDNYASRFTQTSRPYNKPLLILEGQQLRTVSFQAVLADKPSGGVTPITDYLDSLEEIADLGWECVFSYGTHKLNYTCVMSQFSYTVKYRDAEGFPVRAQVSIQLTESSSARQDLYLLEAVYRQPTISTQPNVVAPIDDDNPAYDGLTASANTAASRYEQLYEGYLAAGMPDSEAARAAQQVMGYGL
jgi:hypothetical protein